jgi:ferrous iron transport protein B
MGMQKMRQHGKEVTKVGKKIVLVGNPNVGKSVIFSLLTGKYVMVSNYPGTTVEIAQGNATFDRETVVVDTPGINNLIPMSEDEKVTRDILLKEELLGIVQVADSKNLRRGLLISLQLAEMGLPFVLNLNMEDEARSRGIAIDTGKLSDILGVEVVPTVATQRKGIGALIKGIPRLRASRYSMTYDREIEEGIAEVEGSLPRANISKRSLALMLLAGDESLKPWLHANLKPKEIERIEGIRQELRKKYTEPISYVINRQRLERVDEIIREVVVIAKVERTSISEALGDASMHPILGLPILLFVLYLVYKFVGEFGAGILADFLEEVVFGEYLNPLSIAIVEGLIPIKFVQELLVGEYGVVTMALTYSIAIVLPIVGTFFIAFGILEDSGYLPRLAIMVNNIFRVMGLNGKAVLPLVLGLGCDTMATLTARIMETRKERIIVTLLLALGVPCSAQLGVILGMLGGLSGKAALIWTGVVVVVIFLVGILASKIVPGESSDFVLELPPIRIPQFSNIVVKTLARIEWYLREAVPLFILGTLVLFVSDKLGLLYILERFASPVVVGLLGLPVKATEAFLVGFLRRDYGAAGLFVLAKAGQLDAVQIVVSLVTITLFVPCVANFFIIIKERGLKTALGMVSFIFPFAFLVGGVLNLVLRSLGVVL